MSLVTIGQNLFNNPCPVATKWLYGKQQPNQTILSRLTGCVGRSDSTASKGSMVNDVFESVDSAQGRSTFTYTLKGLCHSGYLLTLSLYNNIFEEKGISLFTCSAIYNVLIIVLIIVEIVKIVITLKMPWTFHYTAG